MIIVKQDPRFADAEDEEEYQKTRLVPLIRDNKTCRLREEVESSDLVKFEPPLYIQRYAKVVEHCKAGGYKTIADFGTAELTFVQYLKNLDFVNQIFAVDIDKDLLSSHKHRCKPLMFDHLNKRKEPLNVSVLCGSVLEFDSRLHDLDCICAIELIEHLQSEDVSTFSDNMFGRLKPKKVIITTPNKDFNVLFEFEPDQMRHWDHKFEWTRQEFKSYCEEVKLEHGYTYELFGVGEPPEDRVSVGPCSQGAIFTRPLTALLVSSPDVYTSHDYEVVYSVDYPVADKSHTPNYHLTNELIYLCNRLGQDRYDAEGEEVSLISITHLQTFPSIEQYRVSDAHIAQLAQAAEQLEVLEDGISIVVRNVPDSPEPSESDVSDGDEDFTADFNSEYVTELEAEW